MKSYLVGGYVRDREMNKMFGTQIESKDRDWVVVGATEQALLDQGFTRVGAFPVFIHPKTREEWALARTEKKAGTGYTGFEVAFSPNVTLEEDLLRRDLTINAMAFDPQDNTLIDPFNGLDDLRQRVLRHVSPAFSEDPLRVLRVARFAARFATFSIAPETLSLMKNMVASNELSALTAERVWIETHSALNERRADIYFDVLKQCNALATIWPELDAIWSSESSDIHTQQTRAILTRISTQQTTASMRYAALCASLLPLPGQDGDREDILINTQRYLQPVEQSCTRFKVANDDKSLARKVRIMALLYADLLSLSSAHILTLLNHLDTWRKGEEFEKVLTLCELMSEAVPVGTHRVSQPALFLRHVVKACRRINAKDFVDQGLKGEQIKQAIAKQRLSIIDAARQQQSGSC